jgi:very-short-patch-repair endonuclease
MDEHVITKEYLENKKSIGQIAKEYNTYPNKILRILRSRNIEIRTKSEAQKLALEVGTSKHPTKDKKMKESTKSRIGAKNAANWQSKSDEEIQSFKEKARENWFKKSSEDRHNMSVLSGKALQRASVEGSRAEKYICDQLIEAGLFPQIHRKDIGGNYEVDIYLPDRQIAIEIDGPHHFIPIFGEDKLQKNIRFDSVKNGILISKGISIIRVKYIKKHVSKSLLNSLWVAIKNELDNMNPQSAKLIEIEV